MIPYQKHFNNPLIPRFLQRIFTGIFFMSLFNISENILKASLNHYNIVEGLPSLDQEK